MHKSTNFILDMVREGDIKHDPWGTALAWSFACAENLFDIGEDVPDSLGYRPSPFGAVIESYEDEEVQSFLDRNDTDEAVESVQYAAKILARYLDWCKLAGVDY